MIAERLNASGILPWQVVWKTTLITNDLIRKTFSEANAMGIEVVSIDKNTNIHAFQRDLMLGSVYY